MVIIVKGQIIGGDYSNILIRQKSSENISLGELLVADYGYEKLIFQVYDLVFGSQISQKNVELISGLKLEEEENFSLMEPELRNYKIATAKIVLSVSGRNAVLCKSLPDFMSNVREIHEDDITFMTKPRNPIFLGNLRSGSEILDISVFLQGVDVFSHHILISATTGKGKSNLTSCVLWSLLEQSYVGVLVLDPHDEYYGRSGIGLKEHHNKDKVKYYTSTNPPPGTNSLKINLKSLKPNHFSFVNFSDPQRQALQSYYRKYKTDWILAIMLEKPLDVDYNDSTLNVLRRRLMGLLGCDYSKGSIYFNGIFDIDSGETTIKDICKSLEESCIVIVDTSHFANDVELLIGNLISSEIFKRYKNYKLSDEIKSKPNISIVLEEAPRVLGKDVLEKGPNIFSSIAREGRKFKIGLFAITQLPSLIPRDILANMNTKIILGMEMSNERQSIIDSASQDLSKDSRAIASLDKGEALISSNFSKFAIPVKFPFFNDLVKETQNQFMKSKYENEKNSTNEYVNLEIDGEKKDGSTHNNVDESFRRNSNVDNTFSGINLD